MNTVVLFFGALALISSPAAAGITLILVFLVALVVGLLSRMNAKKSEGTQEQKEKAESADVPESAGEASKVPAELSAPPEMPVLAGREEPLALSGKETPAALPGAKEETLPDANETKNN